MAQSKTPSAAPALERIDSLIRQGKGKTAQKELKALAHRKLARADRASFAWLSWRLDLPLLGLKQLSALVRPVGRAAGNASDEEKAEYAACLIRAGAGEEALGILEEISEKRVPQALLYRCFALFSQWDYDGALPLLRRYVESPAAGEYGLRVGRINLAAALIFGKRHEEAASLLSRLLVETREKNLPLLGANALELSAQNFIHQKRWGAAEACLEAAAEQLRETGSTEALFVEKWQSIVDLGRTGPSRSALRRLARVRARAVERGQWETVRECDRAKALATGNDALLTHLWFGTPFESYRKRLLADRGGKAPVPNSYRWVLEGPDGPVLSTALGAVEGRDAELKPGQLLHRLLVKLASDFYRPFRLASLFSAIYRDEYFNAISSPARVHEAVKRLREWFHANRFPMGVTIDSGFFRLTATSACALVVSREEGLLDRGEAPLGLLRAAWPTGAFSMKEATGKLPFPRRSVQRLLSEAVDSGTLAREGNGAGSRYRFKP